MLSPDQAACLPLSCVPFPPGKGLGEGLTRRMRTPNAPALYHTPCRSAVHPNG